MPLGAVPIALTFVIFSGGRPQPGYASASLTQPLAELLDGYGQGRYRQYWELTGNR